jgi:hypothetical protein
LGPAINPSSDIDMLTITLAMIMQD